MKIEDFNIKENMKKRGIETVELNIYDPSTVQELMKTKGYEGGTWYENDMDYGTCLLAWMDGKRVRYVAKEKA